MTHAASAFANFHEHAGKKTKKQKSASSPTPFSAYDLLIETLQQGCFSVEEMRREGGWEGEGGGGGGGACVTPFESLWLPFPQFRALQIAKAYYRKSILGMPAVSSFPIHPVQEDGGRLRVAYVGATLKDDKLAHALWAVLPMYCFANVFLLCC